MIISPAKAQQRFSDRSIRTGAGLALTLGEAGVHAGTMLSVGYQHELNENGRARLSYDMLMVEYIGGGIVDDANVEFGRLTALEANFHFDLIKYRAFSIYTILGGGLNYRRGLGQTSRSTYNQDGELVYTTVDPEYYNILSLGVIAGAGLRIAPKNHRLAYEVSPFNFQLNSEGVLLSYLHLGIDIELNKNPESSNELRKEFK